MVVIIVLLNVVIIGLSIQLIFQNIAYDDLYESTVLQLDNVLINREFEVPPNRNTRQSAISSRLLEIKRKLYHEIENEKNARENINTFISDLSHQVRTPLTNLFLYNEILAKKCEISGSLKPIQDVIACQLNSLEWILGSLFKSVYLEEEYLIFDIEYQSIVAAIASSISAVFKKAEDKSIEIHVNEYKDIPILHNKKWTAEAIQNILENSIKYSKENTKITIRITHGDYFSRLVISDEGIGIAKEEQQAIFKRFYRSETVRNIGGSGLGLYIVKSIIEREKGYVTVLSEEGRGASFSIFLQNCKE